MDFSKKNRERKRTIGKSEPRRMEPKIDEAALDAKIAAIRESNRHFFLLTGYISRHIKKKCKLSVGIRPQFCNFSYLKIKIKDHFEHFLFTI